MPRRGAGFGTISASTMAGFGSPSGPVSTQREIRSDAAYSADGPVTIASSLPAGGNETCSARRVRCSASCWAIGIPSIATISNVLTLQLQVDVAIRGSVHEPPELALAGSDLNPGPHGTVYRKDFFGSLRLSATIVGIERNALL